MNTSQFDTPLVFVAGRVGNMLSDEQKEDLRDVLGSVLGSSGRKVGGAGTGTGMEDVRALLMEEESGESEESGNESEPEPEGEGEGESEGSDGEPKPKPQKKSSQGSLEILAKHGKKHAHAPVSESVIPDFSSPLGFIVQATLEERVDQDYFRPSESSFCVETNERY